MEGDPVPDPDHVARYCAPGTLTEDADRKPTGASFLPRTGDNDLSVNWLEYLKQPDRQAELTRLRRAYKEKAKPLKLAAGGKLAVLNVGELVNHVKANSQDGRDLSVRHQPRQGDPSHSAIVGYRHEDMAIAIVIAQVVRARDTYPARG